MAASTGLTTMPGLSGTRKLSLHRRFFRVRDAEGAEGQLPRGGPKDRSEAQPAADRPLTRCKGSAQHRGAATLCAGHCEGARPDRRPDQEACHGGLDVSPSAR